MTLNLNFIILSVVSFFNFYLGYLVFKTKKEKSHFAFLCFCIALGFWVLFYAISFSATSHTLLCTRLIVLPACFIPFTFNWFVATLYSKKNRFSTLEKFIHGSIIFLLVTSLPTPYFITSATFINNSIDFTFGPSYNLLGLYIALGMSSGIYRMFQKYRSSNKIQQRQIQFMGLGVTLGTLIAITLSFILPGLGYTEFNKYTTTASIFNVFFVYYAITKHRLMNISLVINKTGAWVLTAVLFTIGYSISILALKQISTVSEAGYIFTASIFALISSSFFNKVRLFFQTTAEKKFLNQYKNYFDLLPELTKELSKCYNLESLEKVSAHIFNNVLEIKETTIYIDSQFTQDKTNPNTLYRLNANAHLDDKLTPDHPLILLTKQEEKIIVKTECNDIDKNLLQNIPFVLAVPCFNEKQLSAIFLLNAKLSEDIFTTEDLKLLELFSSQISLVLERILPYEKVKKDYENTRQYAEKVSQQKAFSQLSMGIAHEIRNPISNLMVRAEIVETQLDNPSAVLKFSEMIKRNMNRILRITNAMLKYGTPNTSERIIGNVNETITEVIELVEPKCNKLNISIETSLLPVTKLAYDEAALYQAISNIVINAMDAMAEKNNGTLSIASQDTNYLDANRQTVQGIQIKIKDAGIGMNQDTINKLYNPFFTTKYSHIGLGLSMALKIIDAHQGKIEIESTENEGTTFRIFLPIHAT